MDEDSLSHDCEPFFESDGEEESTDGEGFIPLFVRLHHGSRRITCALRVISEVL